VFDDTNLLSHATPYNSRDPQIKLSIAGLDVALLTPTATGLGAYSSTDVLYPRIEVAYTFKNDMMLIKPFAGYLTYDIETPGANQDSKSVSAYLLGVTGKFNFGPAYVNFCVYTDQNGGNYGIALPLGGDGAAKAQLVNGDIEDATGYGGGLVLGFKVSDMVTLEAGYGVTKHEVDTAVNTKTKDGSSTFYFQAPLTMTKGVMIIPEIGMVDDGDFEVGSTKTKEGGYTYYGLKFQIDF
jgi:hypothetical protein